MDKETRQMFKESFEELDRTARIHEEIKLLEDRKPRIAI